MARITQDVRPTSDPSYTRDSRGYDSAPVNKTWGALFEGIGDTVTSVASEVDQNVQNQIKQDVLYGTDKLIGAQGVDAAADQAAQGGTVQFPGSGSFADKASKLQSAYEAGKIGDTQYYSQLEAMTRMVRARYPGYRDQVDAMVQSITGVRPANALRKSIESDLAAEQGKISDQAKYERNEYDQNAKFLTPTERTAFNKGDLKFQDVRAIWLARQGQEHEITTQKAQLELARAKNDVNKDQAEEVANRAYSNIVNFTMNSAMPGSIGNVQQMIQKHGSGQWSPEESAQLEAAVTQAEQALSARLNSEAYKPLDPNNPSSGNFVSMLGAEKTKAMIEAHMQPLRMLTQSLKDKDFSPLEATQRYLKAMENTQAAGMLEGNGGLQALYGAKSILGNEAFSQLMASPGLVASARGAVDVQAALNNQSLARTVNGKGGLTQAMLDLQTAKIKDGKAYQDAITKHVELLRNPTVPIQAKANAAAAIFSDSENGFLSKFKEGDRLRVYQQLLSPEVTKSLTAIKDSGPEGQKAWDSYFKWSTSNFANLFKGEVDNINTINQPNLFGQQLFDVQWDQKTSQFRLNLTDQGKQAGPNVAGIRDWTMGASRTVDNLNKALTSIKPILEAQGKDTGTEVKSFMTQMVTQMQGSQETPQKGFLQKLIDGMIGDKGDKQSSIPQGEKMADGSIDLDAKWKEMTKAANVDLDHVNPELKQFAVDLSQNWGIPLTSGFRDPEHNAAVGGAKASQHMHGNAVDFSLRGLEEAQKQALIDEVMSNPKVKGIGMYGDGSIHIDFRGGSKVAWGHDRSSLDGTPSWFQAKVRSWQST